MEWLPSIERTKSHNPTPSRLPEYQQDARAEDDAVGRRPTGAADFSSAGPIQQERASGPAARVRSTVRCVRPGAAV
jgi:hypothetical protein